MGAALFFCANGEHLDGLQDKIWNAHALYNSSRYRLKDVLAF